MLRRSRKAIFRKVQCIKKLISENVHTLEQKSGILILKHGQGPCFIKIGFMGKFLRYNVYNCLKSYFGWSKITFLSFWTQFFGLIIVLVLVLDIALENHAQGREVKVH